MDEETRSRIQKVRAKVVTEKSKTLELQSQVTDYDLKKTLSNVLMWLGDVETILDSERLTLAAEHYLDLALSQRKTVEDRVVEHGPDLESLEMK